MNSSVPGNGLAFLSAVSCAVLVIGCSSPRILVEPAQIPVFLSGYSSGQLSSKTKNICCALNLFNCVETAVVGCKTVSGKTEPGQEFPVRDIVASEFGRLIMENFTPVRGEAQPQIEMKVETQKVLLSLDGKRFRFDFSAAVKLVNPRHADKPYFTKIYSARTKGIRTNETEVPECVYEAVQNVVAQFLNEISSDESLIERLSSLGR